MEFEPLKSYLLDKPCAWLDFPFGKEAYVFKVKSKMFALLAWKNGTRFLNLKCDPHEAAAVRDIFAAIKPGYHMDKRHWISIYFDDEFDVPEGEVKRLIDSSFELVVSKLTKKEQASIRLQMDSCPG